MSLIQEKKYHLFQNILYVYKGVAKHKPYLIALLFVSIISTAGSKFIWLFLSKYIIEFICDGMAVSELVQVVVLLTIANVLCMLGQNAVNFGKEPAALYVRPMFMLERNKKHMNLPYECLEYKEVLDAIQKSRKSTNWVESGIEGIIRFTLTFCSDMFTCVVAVVILCRIHILMVFVVLAFGLLSYWSIDRAAKKEKYLTNDSVSHTEQKNQYFRKVSRDFSYGKDIRLFHAEPKLMQTQKELQQSLHKSVRKARNEWIKSGTYTSFLELLREGIMYFWLVYLVLERGLGIGNFTLYVGCVRNFAGSFHGLLTVYTKMRQCSREVNDYRTLNEFCDVQDNGNREIVKAKEYEIRFDNVSFSYPGAEDFALKNMNLTITPGQKLAVVGLNGAGKTTFVKLLLRLYEPTSGRIYINGTDIKTYDRNRYYELFSPVFQDMECFAFSLAENVSMKTDKKTDREKAEQCLRQAGLGNKLDEWEKGLDTPMRKVLHKDGILLSGGELQKLALARALYKDAPIVILDEPTAALDAMAESRMYEDFNQLVKGKAAIYISHRLASTRFCDKIALFEQGEVVEYGTHEELIKHGGKYAEMFAMQAHYYKEGNHEVV